MDCPRHQFLARARLPVDQHRCRAHRDAIDLVEHRQHWGARADDRRRLARAADLLQVLADPRTRLLRVSQRLLHAIEFRPLRLARFRIKQRHDVPRRLPARAHRFDHQIQVDLPIRARHSHAPYRRSTGAGELLVEPPKQGVVRLEELGQRRAGHLLGSEPQPIRRRSIGPQHSPPVVGLDKAYGDEIDVDESAF